MGNDEDIQEKLESMRKLCATRPVRYSDLDHLKKGSTKFLQENAYSLDEIAEALNLNLRDVENNLKGTGFELDNRKISPFEANLPENIGDIVKIKIPSWDGDVKNLIIEAQVVQCIPQGGGCGLSVILIEDVEFEIPLYGKSKKGDEIVVPLEWLLK
ncbi:MAG: hypothetical protein R2741_14285 [Methanolobus sp.]